MWVELDSLKRLSLGNNELKDLPDGAFIGLTELEKFPWLTMILNKLGVACLKGCLLCKSSICTAMTSPLWNLELLPTYHTWIGCC